MGGVGHAAEVECRATVHGVGPIRELRIIKDGEVAWSQSFDELDVTATWHDPEPPKREHYYYLQVFQGDGQMAWSGPIWIGPSSG